MKRNFFVLCIIIFLIGNLYSKKSKIPGIAVMRKHGTKLTPTEILDKIGDVLLDMGTVGQVSYLAYSASLKAKNKKCNGYIGLSPIWGDKSRMSIDIDFCDGELINLFCTECEVPLSKFSKCDCGGDMVVFFLDKEAITQNVSVFATG